MRANRATHLPLVLAAVALGCGQTSPQPRTRLIPAQDAAGMTELGEMPGGRWDHTAVVVGSELFVMGGLTLAKADAAYAPTIVAPLNRPLAPDSWYTVADPPTRLGSAWSSMSVASGTLVTQVGGLAPTGEMQGAIAAIWMSPTGSSSWGWIGHLPTHWAFGAATSVGDRLFVLGGQRDNEFTGQAIPFVLSNQFDPQSGRLQQTWTSQCPLPASRMFFGVAASGGHLYAVGGEDGRAGGAVSAFVDIADLQPDGSLSCWRRGPSLPAPRRDAGVVVAAGKLYVVGGSPAPAPGAEVPGSTTIWAADIDGATGDLRPWQVAGQFGSPRQGAAVLVDGGRLLIVGGVAIDPQGNAAAPPEVVSLPLPNLAAP